MAIESLIKENGVVYMDHEISVQLRSAPFYIPISMKVRQIHVANRDFLLLPDLTSESNDLKQSIAAVPSLPYALDNSGIDQAEPTCREYIDTICKHPLDDFENMKGTTSKIIWRLLKSILHFLRVNRIARQASILSCLVER